MQFLLGNLQNFALWELLSTEQDLYSLLPEFSHLQPLSYLPLRENILSSIEARLDCELRLSAEGATGGKRIFHWDDFLILLHQKIFQTKESLLLVKIKKLFEMRLKSENVHKRGSWVELSLPLECLPKLCVVLENFLKEHQLAYQAGSLHFTRQPLEDFGIRFPNGCFYEASGYGIHCFFLRDLGAMFLFQTPATFPSVWYVFLRILAEMEYFEVDLNPYLSMLEESIRIYPWSKVDSHS